MNNYTKLFNRIIALSFAILAISFANSVFQLAVATLPTATILPSNETLQALDSVIQEEMQTKSMANKKPLQQLTDVNQVSNTTLAFYSGRALAISTGAVIGVAALSFITNGTAIPQTITAAVGGTSAHIASATSSAISMYAIVSAAIGGLAGDYLFMAMQSQDLQDKVGK